MKTTITIIFLSLSFGAATQNIKGVSNYVDVPVLKFVTEKVHVLSNGDYEFQIQDAFDGKIDIRDAKEVLEELQMLADSNGVALEDPYILYAPKRLNPTPEGILKEIAKGCSNLMIRYNFIEGLFVYINLNDGFCGMVITKDKTD